MRRAAAHGILDVRDVDVLADRQLRDVGEGRQRQAVGAIRIAAYRLGALCGIGFLEAGEQADQLLRRHCARFVVGLADDQRGDAFGVEGEPRGQVLYAT